MKRAKKKVLIRSLNYASALVMFTSLVILLAVGRPAITGETVSIQVNAINAAQHPLGVLGSVLVAIVIVAAILYLGSKFMESRV